LSQVAKKVEVKVVAGPYASDVSVTDFLAEIEAVHTALKALAESTTSSNPVVWRVADLHHSDPVVWFGTDEEAEGDRIARTLLAGIEGLAHGIDTGDLSHYALEAIRTALKPVGDGVTAVVIGLAELSVSLDLDLKRAFEKVSFKHEFFIEEWEGLLEFINVHTERPSCRLYPLAGPEWISCEFDRDQIAIFKDALTKKVSLYGRAAYRPRDRFPYRIQVQHLTVIEHSTDDITEVSGVLADERDDIFERLTQVRDGWH